MRQTTVQEFNSIRFGSGKFEVDDGGGWINLGAMRNIQFEEEWDKVRVMSHNAGMITARIQNHRAALAGDLMEINLANLAKMRGGLDEYSTVAGTKVEDVEQYVGSDDWAFEKFIKIENQNHDKGAITIDDVAGKTDTKAAEENTTTTEIRITAHGLEADDYIRNTTRGEVRKITGTTDDTITVVEVEGQTEGDLIELYVAYDGATDYDQLQDAQGNRGIVVYDETTPDAGHDLMILYEYTPAEHKLLESGGKVTINPVAERVTNYNENEEPFIITVHKAEAEEGINIELQGDDEEDPAMTPIRLMGDMDETKDVGKQLFRIEDYQNV